jgi:hypothetical protein
VKRDPLGGWYKMHVLVGTSGAVLYRSTAVWAFCLTLGHQSDLTGQTRFDLTALASRTQAFGGTGPGFTLGVGLPVPAHHTWLSAAVGAVYWHARTQIVSFPNDPYGRRISGVGPVIELRQAPWRRGPRLYQAASAQLATSRIPDRYQLGIARDSLPTIPREDFIDTRRGLGLAAELGVRQPVIGHLGVTVAASAVHQQLFPAAAQWFTRFQVGLHLSLAPAADQPPNPANAAARRARL